jgi:hypothetical protein
MSISYIDSKALLTLSPGLISSSLHPVYCITLPPLAKNAVRSGTLICRWRMQSHYLEEDGGQARGTHVDLSRINVNAKLDR